MDDLLPGTPIPKQSLTRWFSGRAFRSIFTAGCLYESQDIPD